MMHALYDQKDAGISWSFGNDICFNAS